MCCQFTFSYYLTQKKTLEINPRHPLIKELLRRVEANPEDPVSKGMAMMMFQTGTVFELIIFAICYLIFQHFSL